MKNLLETVKKIIDNAPTNEPADCAEASSWGNSNDTYYEGGNETHWYISRLLKEALLKDNISL